jgi:hypothetical protein
MKGSIKIIGALLVAIRLTLGHPHHTHHHDQYPEEDSSSGGEDIQEFRRPVRPQPFEDYSDNDIRMANSSTTSTSTARQLRGSFNTEGNDVDQLLSKERRTSKIFDDINWSHDDAPLRIGDTPWKTVGEFKRQRGRCTTPDLTEDERMESDKILRHWKRSVAKSKQGGGLRRLQTIDIPVYFHCITSGSAGSCMLSTVNQQIAVLNSAFAPTFSFTLVSAQNYDRPEYYTCAMFSGTETQMHAELRQGGPGTLNLYTCNTSKGELGWATYPNRSTRTSKKDGVIIRRGTLPGGTDAPYNLGYTATHEVKNSLTSRTTALLTFLTLLLCASLRPRLFASGWPLVGAFSYL